MTGLAVDTLVITTVLVLAAVTLGTLAARLFMAATRPQGPARGRPDEDPSR